jgi:CheY-like chemotaxis protein
MATKPLILAIEPDRRQASCLSSVARRISAELQLVQSVAEALTALRGPLPHLILTPTLLPCRDDTMLTERLRELGDAATHIQRLTTPLFEAEAPRRGRVLPKLRRGKAPATGAVGCKAETFAEQLAIYLEGAVAAHPARRRARDRRPAEPAAVTPLPSVSLHVPVESAVSALDALPFASEAVCSVDALITALSSTPVGEMFVATPLVALPAVAELPAIRASRDAGVLAGDAAGSPLVPAPPTMLRLDAAALRAIRATSEDRLSRVPEPIGPCELKAPELVPPKAPPTVGAGRKPRPVTQTAVVTPNGRQRRKIMRRMRSNDWTA